MDAIKAGDRVVVTVGNREIGIRKGEILRVIKVQPMGAAFGHFVGVTVQPIPGAQQLLYVRHENRLQDETISLGNGNGIDRVKVRRK